MKIARNDMKLTRRDLLFHIRVLKKQTIREKQKRNAGSIDHFCNWFNIYFSFDFFLRNVEKH